MQNDLYCAGALRKIKTQQQITYTIDYKCDIVYTYNTNYNTAWA